MKIFRCIFRLYGMHLLLCDNLRINRCIWMYVGLCLETSSRTINIKVCIGFRNMRITFLYWLSICSTSTLSCHSFAYWDICVRHWVMQWVKICSLRGIESTNPYSSVFFVEWKLCYVIQTNMMETFKCQHYHKRFHMTQLINWHLCS